MCTTRLFANSRLPYASPETKPAAASTKAASIAIAKRRRNENTDKETGTRRRSVPTRGTRNWTPTRRLHAPFTRPSLHRKAQPSCDDEALDLARALADLEDLRVAIEAAHRGLVDIAVAAVDLHRFARRAYGDLTRVQFRHRGRVSDRSTLLAQPCGLVDEITRVLDRHSHVGTLERDRLVPTDRPAERLALIRVGDRRIEARARHTQRQRGDRDAPVIENAQERLEALAPHTENVVFRDATAVEHE